jgi:hypothetical protein
VPTTRPARTASHGVQYVPDGDPVARAAERHHDPAPDRLPAYLGPGSCRSQPRLAAVAGCAVPCGEATGGRAREALPCCRSARERHPGCWADTKEREGMHCGPVLRD